MANTEEAIRRGAFGARRRCSSATRYTSGGIGSTCARRWSGAEEFGQPARPRRVRVSQPGPPATCVGIRPETVPSSA